MWKHLWPRSRFRGIMKRARNSLEELGDGAPRRPRISHGGNKNFQGVPSPMRTGGPSPTRQQLPLGVAGVSGAGGAVSSTSKPPATQDVDVGEETALRMRLLAEKHKNDLYRSTRAKVVKANLKNPRDANAVGFQLCGEDGKHFHVTLQGSWCQEHRENPWMLDVGDVVHLLGDPTMYDQIAKTRHCELSDNPQHEHRLLVMHPDVLLTGTAVSNALNCRRYALIQYEISEAAGSTNAGSRALVLGNIVHGALQAAMAAQDFSDAFLDNVLRENVQSALVELWHIGVSTDEMFNECRNRLKHATKWAQQYYVPLGGVDVVAKAGGKPKPRIRHLVGNEQNVCSHRFGFKGKLDGLVRTDDANKTAALEIKTGRIRTEHVGQITVYYMLLCDLVNQQLQPELQACSSSALLLYPHKDECTYEAKRISRFDVRAIMQIRNMLASTIQRRRQTLEEGRLRGPVWPPMIPRENGMEPSDCKRCFRKDHCYTLAASVENQPQLRPELDSRVRAYIQKWLMVIDAEEVLGAKAKERPWRTNTTLNRDKAPNVVNPSSAQQGVQKAVDGAAPEAKVKDQDAKEGGSGSSGLRYLKFEEAVLVKPSNHPNMFGVNNSEEHQFHWIFSVPDSEAAAKLQAFSSGGPRSSQLDFEDYAVASAKPKKKNAGGPFGSGTSEAALSMRALTLGADENAAKASNTTKQQQELAGSQPSPELVQSILSLPFTVGDQITISREPEGPFSLFQATVVNIDCEGRRVTVRPRTEIRATLRSDAGAQMCTTQLTDIEDLQRAAGVASAQQLSTCEFYRMDKDEYGGGFAKIRGDLMQLVCTQELMNPFVGKIKRKLIFLEPPTFSDVELGEQVGTTVMPKTPPEMIAEGTNCLTQWQRMNLTQQNVIRRCFQADDYCVVQGFPGTGKTEVLASLLELYVRNGKRVLFCAYTNAAVDNGLLRLLRNASEAGKRPMQIVRLGSNEQKVHNEVRPYLLQNRNLNSIQDVNGFIQSVQLVACTLLGCHDALVQHLAFDLVVVDEASQATEPATWCALFKTRKFVLFGDTNQLQPLVKHPKAIQFGLQRSLMERLSEEQPACVAELNVQYRMNEEIQKLPNKLIYNGKLVCGSDAVKYRKLTAYTLGDVTTKEGWLRAALDPDRKVVFLDTMDSLPEDMASRQENQGEANLCQELVRSLLSLGLFEADIGVLSPYRRQLALIKEVLGPERPEVLTVDEAQGKDKKCVIVSLVKSNRERKVGQLLTDWRRMNVLLTRAQCKLVLIGSVPTLHTNELMRNMLETCHDNAWIVPVSR